MKNVLKMILAFCCFDVLCLAVMAAQGTSPTSAAGSLWVMGANNYGQLGDATTDEYAYYTNRPEQVVPGGVTAVSGGYYFSLFIKSDGSLWAMGDNEYGELGDGTTDNGNEYTNRPEQIVPGGATTVAAIAAGGFHSLFIKSDGSLWGMGYNDLGQLGNDTYSNAAVPIQIVPSGVTAVAGGYAHSLYLMTNGSLWAMGDNVQGQLGNGGINYYSDQPQKIVPSGVTAIAAGSYHTLFLKSDGSLWGVGNNTYGQLGNVGVGGYVYTAIEIESSNVTAIAAGAETSMFIKSDGSLWGMGTEQDGTLGDGTTDYEVTTPEMIEPSNITAIASGGYSSMFIMKNGSLWTMGENQEGQEGNGTVIQVNVPTQIEASGVAVIGSGFEHSMFIQTLLQPVITGVSPSGPNITINASNGMAAGIYVTLESTLLSRPINLWTPVQTNILSAGGNFTITVTNGFNPSAPEEFFMLELQ